MKFTEFNIRKRNQINNIAFDYSTIMSLKKDINVNNHILEALKYSG